MKKIGFRKGGGEVSSCVVCLYDVPRYFLTLAGGKHKIYAVF